MASFGSLRVLLESLHTHLECKVCMESFTCHVDEDPDRRPMSLCCGHVLCAECVHLLGAIAVATSADGRRELLCPFCRLASRLSRIAPCRPLVELQEELQLQEKQWDPDSWPEEESVTAPPGGVKPSQASAGKALDRGCLRLVRVFGGWGTLVNPTSMALFRSGALAVVHDGKQRVAVFGGKGRRLHGFGWRSKARSGLIYPLGVAVLPSDHVLVTDGGGAALRVFTSRGGTVAEADDWLGLPWGVAVCGDGGVLVTDEQRGALWRVEVDVGRGQLRGHRLLLEGLESPRALACCPLTGHIALVEHLTGDGRTRTHEPTGGSGDTHPPSGAPPQQTGTRLRILSSDLTPLALIDSFSLGNRTGSPAPQPCLTSVTFDSGGHLIAADAGTGMVWSLGRPWVGGEEGQLRLTPLVRGGLVRPTGLQVSGDTLFVLDSGDQAVKIYSSQPEAPNKA